MGAGEDEVGGALLASVGEFDIDDGEKEAAVLAEEAPVLGGAVGVVCGDIVQRHHDVVPDKTFEQRIIGTADGADNGGAGRLGAARLRFHARVPGHGGGGVCDRILESVEPVASAAGEASMEAGTVSVAQGLVAAVCFVGGEHVEETDEAADAVVLVTVDQVGVARVGPILADRGDGVPAYRLREGKLQSANLRANAAFELLTAEEIEPHGVAAPLTEAGVALPGGDNRGQDGGREDDEDRDEEGAVQHVARKLRCRCGSSQFGVGERIATTPRVVHSSGDEE